MVSSRLLARPCSALKVFVTVIRSPRPSAAAPGERRGVSAGGGSLPGGEEEGGGRWELILPVCQSSLGNQLPVEG